MSDNPNMLKPVTDLYSATLLADASITSCKATFKGGDKQYTYLIDTVTAGLVVPGDYLIVDHNKNEELHMVTLVSVDVVPDCHWSRNTRSVVGYVSREAMQQKLQLMQQRRETIYRAAKQHVDAVNKSKVMTERLALQGELGISMYFNQPDPAQSGQVTRNTEGTN